MPRRGNGEGSVFRRNDGRWVAEVSLPGGKRKYLYAKTRKDALARQRILQRQLEDGLPVSPARLTIGAYLRNWLDETLPARVKAGRMRPSTLDSYADNVRLHVLPYLGAERMPVKPATLRAWLSDLQDAPRRPRCMSCAAADRAEPGGLCAKHATVVRTADWPRLSTRTVAYCHAILRAAFSDAVDDELIARNPAVLVQPPAVSSKPARPLTLTEAAAVLVAALEDRLSTLWLLMLAVGLRRGEALALRWDQVDFEARTVTVAGSLQRLRGQADPATGIRHGRLVEVRPKTAASAATIALPPSVVDALLEHRQQQVKQRMGAKTWVDPDLVFTTSVGTPLEPRNVHRAWQALCRRAGVPEIRIHDLRHSTATLLLHQGVDLKIIQSQLRHSRFSTTADLYTHVLDEVQHGAAERMDELLRQLVPQPERGAGPHHR